MTPKPLSPLGALNSLGALGGSKNASQNPLYPWRSWRLGGYGFTLTEALIVISIIGILSAIAIPSWLTFLNVLRLNAAQAQVYRAMREAQSQAKQEKLIWQVSFREVDNLVQWAVHPATIEPANANWHNLESSVRLDTETTLQRSNGIRRTQFDYKGNVILNPTQYLALGQLTLSSRNGGKAKRCVVVSTMLGAMRTAKEQPRPRQGKYCY